MSEPSRPTGLLLSDDLLFTSRITGTAHDLGFTIRAVRSAASLEELARSQNPACVIVDLANAGLVITELIEHLRQACQPMPFVVGYGSHVNVDTLRAAHAAGCDVVLPRSKFVENLPHELPSWMVARERS